MSSWLIINVHVLRQSSSAIFDGVKNGKNLDHLSCVAAFIFFFISICWVDGSRSRSLFCIFFHPEDHSYNFDKWSEAHIIRGTHGNDPRHTWCQGTPTNLRLRKSNYFIDTYSGSCPLPNSSRPKKSDGMPQESTLLGIEEYDTKRSKCSNSLRNLALVLVRFII